MTKDEEKEPVFKVVDRRRFTEEGAKNENSEEPVSKKTPDLKKEVEQPKIARERPPLDFSLFIQSLGHQTMMGLGIIPWPDSGLVRVELTMAKETIDILQILKEKTAGNLTEEEAHLLESLVYQLKMAFVGVSKQSPPDASPLITKK